MYYFRLRRYRNTLMTESNTQRQNDKPRIENAGFDKQNDEDKILSYFGLTITGKCE